MTTKQKWTWNEKKFEFILDWFAVHRTSLYGGNLDSRMRVWKLRTSVNVNEPSPCISHTQSHAHTYTGTRTLWYMCVRHAPTVKSCDWQYENLTFFPFSFRHYHCPVLQLKFCVNHLYGDENITRSRLNTRHIIKANREKSQFSHKNPSKNHFSCFILSDGSASSCFNFGILGIHWNYSTVFGTKRGQSWVCMTVKKNEKPPSAFVIAKYFNKFFVFSWNSIVQCILMLTAATCWLL